MYRIVRENSKLSDPKEFAEKDLQGFLDWFSTLEIKRRAPVGINKTDHQVLLSVKERVEDYNRSSLPSHLRIQEKKLLLLALTNLRVDIEEIESYYKNKGSSKPEVITKRNATYYKKSSFAYSSFIENIERIENLLSDLDYPHSLVTRDLHIEFRDGKDIKSIAKYKTDKDIMIINPKKVSSLKNVYGSLEYVVLHELGHRFLRKNPQSWDIDNPKWTTTKYSQVDSFSGEERFAELFALSHFARQYPEYRDTIDSFLSTIEA